MLIAIFGENCTGKSTLANVLKQKLGAAVYTGKDYLRLARNEAEAQQRFRVLLRESVSAPDSTIFIISEADHLDFLPAGCIRVLVTAPLDDIKSRFAARMNGVLPAAVASRLERSHGAFDRFPHHIEIRTGERHILEDCAHILALVDGRG